MWLWVVVMVMVSSSQNRSSDSLDIPECRRSMVFFDKTNIARNIHSGATSSQAISAKVILKSMAEVVVVLYRQ